MTPAQATAVIDDLTIIITMLGLILGVTLVIVIVCASAGKK